MVYGLLTGSLLTARGTIGLIADSKKNPPEYFTALADIKKMY